MKRILMFLFVNVFSCLLFSRFLYSSWIFQQHNFDQVPLQSFQIKKSKRLENLQDPSLLKVAFGNFYTEETATKLKAIHCWKTVNLRFKSIALFWHFCRSTGSSWILGKRKSASSLKIAWAGKRHRPTELTQLQTIFEFNTTEKGDTECKEIGRGMIAKMHL